MKKALIFTLYGNINYGNKLQNYAVQEILKKYGIESYTVVFNNRLSLKTKIKTFIKLLLPNYRNEILKSNLRKKNFLQFDNKINKISYDKINLDDYDYIFVGSDQVWNPNDLQSQIIVDFINNIHNKTVISISASVAADDIAEPYIEKYKEHFNHINYISTREFQGKDIIKKLTGRKDIDVLVDPTMLLTKKEWEKVSTKSIHIDNIKNKKYILNYFLGNLSDSRKKEIERIAKENDCEIINLLDKNDPYYICGPSDFLYLEENAFLICTDSFHSCVFAILYDKPFIVFNREQENINNMNSRLETLFNKFKLENRKYNERKITLENLNHNYSEVYKLLEIEIKKSEKFLKHSIKNR